MIVTFHVALYLAYRLWENYVSSYFGNNEVNDTNDVECPNSGSVVNHNPDSRPIITPQPETDFNSPNEPNISFEPNSGTTSATHHAERKQMEVEEGYRLLLSCLYNVSDTFKDCSDNNKKKPIDQNFSCIYTEGKEIRFVPPAYVQRYMVIQDFLQELQWKNVTKVVDFGCAELSFEVLYLKKLSNIQEIVAVDVDFKTLDDNKHKAIPNAVDHIEPRPTPLTVKIYCGSVGHTNDVLKGADAVIAIELIEHLYPPDLECLAYTVFGFIRPRIAMFTTPNADFNVLFHNFDGTRHWDHKFEWTREQFEDWGNNLVRRYPEYSVSYRGISPGPPGSEHLGCLSQMAIFVRIHTAPPLHEEELRIQEGSYKLVQESVFPYYEDKRTRTEIIKDDALSFIRKCVMLSYYSDDYEDEARRKELPIKNIMERIKCYNKKKLIDILKEENFEIITNAFGCEVVILPDPESEENSLEDFSDGCSVDPVYDTPVANRDDTLISDENWDCDWNVEPKEANENLSVAFLAAETAFNENQLLSVVTDINNVPAEFNKQENYSKDFYGSHEPISKDDSKVGLSTSLNLSTSDNSTKDMSLEELQHETLIVDDSLVNGSCNKFSLDLPVHDSIVERLCPKDNIVIDGGTESELSIYETPNCFTSCSNCELYNPSSQSLYHSESTPNSDCKRQLSFESPVDSKGTHPEKYKTDFTNADNVYSTTSVVSSPNESLCFGTPCCSDIQKKSIPKCLSLQQINGCSFFDYESEQCMTSGTKDVKYDSISKSMDGFKNQQICDIHETCSTTSKVIDSGYPNSYSEHNMDLDSTQADDIGSQSEGDDVNSRFPSPVEPIAPPLPQRVVDNVENGDVANNNRDGEGNNMVDEMEEDFFDFEAQIEEGEVLNLAIPLPEEFDRNLRQGDHSLGAPCPPLGVDCSKSNSSGCSPPSLNSQGKASKISKSLKEFPSIQGCYVYNNKITDQQDTKSVLQDSIIVSESTCLGSLYSSESMSDVSLEQRSQLNSHWHHPKVGGHNSLTTVLEGCSKFSDCSLVCPIKTSSSPNNEGDLDGCRFPKWLLKIDYSVCEADESIKRSHSCDSLKTFHLHTSQCQLSLPSLYHSLSSTSNESENEENATLYFPRWLLDIQVSETEESNVAVVSSDISVWDVESDNGLVEGSFNVQVDARGGGDPQRDGWFD